MTNFRCAILVCVCILVSHTQARWSQCGQGAFQISDATLQPEEIYPGNSARFTIDALAGGNDVSGGTIAMLVRLGGLPIYTQQDDLCTKTSCPIQKESNAQIIYEQSFPEFTPAGPYSVMLSGKSSTGEQLFCVVIAFQVNPLPPSGAKKSLGDQVGRLLESRKAQIA